MNAIICDPETRSGSRAITGNRAIVLRDIARDDVDIAVWKRKLDAELASEIDRIDMASFGATYSTIVTSRTSALSILKALRNRFDAPLLAWDMANLVKRYLKLFELDRARLKLTGLDRTMCPKFHVDRVPCRLVTTYRGKATEWLPHNCVDRGKLGKGAHGKPDYQSGVYRDCGDIHRLDRGDVGLLKGKLWRDDEATGQVHRSPVVLPGEERLLMSLDYVEGDYPRD